MAVQEQQLLKDVYEEKASQAEARHRHEVEQAAAALEASEAARQAAQEELAQARTAHATAESRRAAEAAQARAERQELDAAMAEKDRALTRALSNYKEEVLRWGIRLQARWPPRTPCGLWSRAVAIDYAPVCRPRTDIEEEASPAPIPYISP